MTAQEKQKSLIPVLRTLLILTVSALAFGTEAMAQPGDTDNPGAGVAAILDEDTVPEEASLKRPNRKYVWAKQPSPSVWEDNRIKIPERHKKNWNWL